MVASENHLMIVSPILEMSIQDKIPVANDCSSNEPEQERKCRGHEQREISSLPLRRSLYFAHDLELLFTPLCRRERRIGAEVRCRQIRDFDGLLPTVHIMNGRVSTLLSYTGGQLLLAPLQNKRANGANHQTNHEYTADGEWEDQTATDGCSWRNIAKADSQQRHTSAPSRRYAMKLIVCSMSVRWLDSHAHEQGDDHVDDCSKNRIIESGAQRVTVMRGIHSREMVSWRCSQSSCISDQEQAGQEETRDEETEVTDHGTDSSSRAECKVSICRPKHKFRNVGFDIIRNLLDRLSKAWIDG
ncbi:hypothetical protein KC333_g18 [Hortaea werneckii]|nr:hypothetical protein KC333_g18 [Hortaea werneckii]